MGFSEKVFLKLDMPTEDSPVSDQQRIRQGLQALGFDNVTLPLHILRKLHPTCRNSHFEITVTLVFREQDWVVTALEPGDQTQSHYGLSVDYGSTTIVMELVDMRSGAVIDQVKTVNLQT